MVPKLPPFISEAVKGGAKRAIRAIRAIRAKLLPIKRKKKVKKGIILYSLMGYVEFYVP